MTQAYAAVSNMLPFLLNDKTLITLSIVMMKEFTKISFKKKSILIKISYRNILKKKHSSYPD